MKKILNPPWAPDNFGALLKNIRVATCGTDLYEFDHHLFGLCERMVKAIEAGRRNISELETFYYLSTVRVTSGDKLDAYVRSHEDLPPELLRLVRETVPAVDAIKETGFLAVPDRLRDW